MNKKIEITWKDRYGVEFKMDDLVVAYFQGDNITSGEEYIVIGVTRDNQPIVDGDDGLLSVVDPKDVYVNTGNHYYVYIVGQEDISNYVDKNEIENVCYNELICRVDNVILHTNATKAICPMCSNVVTELIK